MSSIMRCRSGLMALSVMRDAPVLMKVANPSSQDRTPRRAIGVGCVVRRGALPRERFSPLGRVGMWRGGCRSNISVAASFVWRCLTGSAMAPFPHPAHRTGDADLPHPALGQELTLSRATPSAVSDHLSELIGFPISKVLPYVLRLS